MTLFLKLNEEVAHHRRKHLLEQVQETEKAIQIRYTCRTYRTDTGELRRETIEEEWLPKSQIEVFPGGWIAVPGWLLNKKKRLPHYEVTVSLNNVDLKEKTGLHLPDVTIAQRLELLGKGYARANYHP